MYDLKCKVCGFESSDLEEVCYYDINGWSHSDEYDIENNSNNPDALAHILCAECAEKFNFNKQSQLCECGQHLADKSNNDILLDNEVDEIERFSTYVSVICPCCGKLNSFDGYISLKNFNKSTLES